MSELDFKTLREANRLRIPHFRDKEGNLAHTEPDGSDWNLDRWMGATTGEVGELAGELKKAARGDYGPMAKAASNGDVKTMPESIKLKMAKEMADIVIYLDILAYQMRIDLGAVIVEKFNEVSNRVEAPIWIHESNVTGHVSVIDESSIPF